MKKTIGGDRLGSGNKMSVNLHGYGRSTHNLSRAWRSSMAPGTLVPFLIEPALNGDTFEIELADLVRTLPTASALFGEFKMQADIFCTPIRLYNAALHNNKLNIGMDMSQVIFPKLRVTGPNLPADDMPSKNQQAINPSSLLAYLGMRGVGTSDGTYTTPVIRNFNALPYLMYFDIFKNYYANKQEENAYMMLLGGESGTGTTGPDVATAAIVTEVSRNWRGTEGADSITLSYSEFDAIRATVNKRYTLLGNNLNLNNIKILGFANQTTASTITLNRSSASFSGTIQDLLNIRVKVGNDTNYVPWAAAVSSNSRIEINANISGSTWATLSAEDQAKCPAALLWEIAEATEGTITATEIQSFPLTDIDDMRERILKQPTTTPLIIDSTDSTIYGALLQPSGVYQAPPGQMKSVAPLSGLLLKTYQSDRFNNWLSQEWIEGANSISALTAVQTSSGSFTMDSLNLAQKVYDMLNRIAVSGGSYVDWQEAVYGVNAMRRAETPMFMGGYSTRIQFNEVVSTAQSEGEPLGTLGGRGHARGNSSRIKIKVEEPSIIMGIVSITPLVDYSQGNKWFTYELETMDDLHKPALDGIGFQDLNTEEMAPWDTTVDEDGNPTFYSAGKQPAWIQYMTSQSECYGTFANGGNTSFMTIQKRFVPGPDGHIANLTTYIDPYSANYVFAQTDITAQNFWVQLGIEVIARRRMSAKMIPNL